MFHGVLWDCVVRGGSRGGGQGALAPAHAEKCPQLWQQLFCANPRTALKTPNFYFRPPPTEKAGSAPDT